MKIIGIDPGKSGGISLFIDDQIKEVMPMPIYEQDNGKDTIDFKKVSEYFKLINPDKVYIEKVGAMKAQGVSSMFNFGFTTGGLHGICAALGISLTTVTPQKWKKVILSEKYDHIEKEGTILFCKDMFPNISLLATARSKVPHNGMCDAIAIGYYGVLNNKEPVL